MCRAKWMKWTRRNILTWVEINKFFIIYLNKALHALFKVNLISNMRSFLTILSEFFVAFRFEACDFEGMQILQSWLLLTL
jgi:hypothetical protein